MLFFFFLSKPVAQQSNRSLSAELAEKCQGSWKENRKICSTVTSENTPKKKRWKFIFVNGKYTAADRVSQILILAPEDLMAHPYWRGG